MGKFDYCDPLANSLEDYSVETEEVCQCGNETVYEEIDEGESLCLDLRGRYDITFEGKQLGFCLRCGLLKLD